MDAVNHPPHYNSGRFEVVEIIEDQKLNFHLGNAVKYICRAGKKDPNKTVEDLEKAIWYVRRQIEGLKAAAQGKWPGRPNDMNPRSTSVTDALNSGQPGCPPAIVEGVVEFKP